MWRSLGILFALLIGLSLFLVFTQAGARSLIGFALPRLPVEVQVGRVEGKLAGPLTLHDVAFSNEQARLRIGTFRVDIAEWKLLRQRIQVTELRITEVRVETLEVSGTPSETADAPAKEPATPFDPPEVVLELGELQDAVVILPDSTQLSLEDLQLAGTLDDYHLEAVGSVKGPTVPTVDYKLSLNGDLQQVFVDALELTTLGGNVTIGAQAQWLPEIQWQADVQARQLDPSLANAQLAEWPGAVDLDLTTTGSLPDEGLRAQAELSRLSGQVRELELSGRILAQLEGEHVQVDSLRVQWGPARVTGEGSMTETVLADFSVFVDEISRLEPRFAGALALTAHAEGPRDALAVELEAEGSHISDLTHTVERLAVRAEATVMEDAAFDAAIDVWDVRADSTLVDSLSVRLTGALSSHALIVQAAGAQATAGFGLTGGLVDSTWTGAIDSLRVTHPLSGTWQSAGAAALRASPIGVALETLRLASGDAFLELAGSANKAGDWQAEFSMDRLGLAQLPIVWPDDLSATGYLRASASLKGQGPTALGDVNASVEACSLRVAGEVPLELTLDQASFDATIDEQALRAKAVAAMHRNGAPLLQFDADATVAGFAGADSFPPLPLEGSITASVVDLSFVEKFAPDLAEVAGRIEAHFELGGTLGAPVVPGKFELVDGKIIESEIGLELTELRMVAEGDPRGGFTLDGCANAGQGSLAITGQAPSTPSQETPVVLTLKADQARLANTPELLVYINSDLNIQATPDTVKVTGSLGIPRAEIMLVETPPSAVAPSSDVRFVGPEAAQSPPLAVPVVDVQVELGKEIFFRGLNYASRVEGSLRVQMVGDEPPTGTGEIRLIDGYFREYGQNLEIQQGRVFFSGPLENPTLQIEAARMADDGTEAGVRVTGTAEAPEITLYSDPAREQRDVISYIMTGQPMNSTSGEQQSKVADAAAVMGGSMLTSKMGSKVGLDEARVEGSEDMDEASLVVGKYLNPRLFVSYGMGLFERTNSFRARFILTPRWSVQTETGTDTGADVLYRIEVGGD